MTVGIVKPVEDHQGQEHAGRPAMLYRRVRAENCSLCYGHVCTEAFFQAGFWPEKKKKKKKKKKKQKKKKS